MFTETLPTSGPRPERTKPRPPTAAQCQRLYEMLANDVVLQRELGRKIYAVKNNQGKAVKFPILVIHVADAIRRQGKHLASVKEGDVLRIAAKLYGLESYEQPALGRLQDHDSDAGEEAIEDHPIASRFPLMDESQLGELAADIKKHGLRESIVVYDGKILDGRDRYRACRMVGAKPSFIKYDGESPIAFVLSANVQRRHLTRSQLAALAVEFLPLFEQEAKKRQQYHGGTAPGRTKTPSANLREVSEPAIKSKGQPAVAMKSAAAAATILQASSRYIEMAKSLKLADAGKFDEVLAGHMTLNAAMSDLKTSASKRRPRTAVEYAKGICDNLTAKIGKVPDAIKPEVIALLRQKFNTEFPE